MGSEQGFSDNQMISARQAAWILVLDLLAAGLFWLPACLSGRSFLQMLIGGMAALLIVFLYYLLPFLWLQWRNAKGRSIDQAGSTIIVLRIFLLVYYLFAIVGSIRFFNQVFDSLIPGGCRYPVPIIFLLAVVIYSSGKGIEIRGRMAELLGWLVCIPFFVLFMAGCWQAIRQGWLMDTDLIMDEWQGMAVWQYMLPVSWWFFLLGDHPVFLWQHMHVSKKTFPVLLWGLAGGCLMVFAALFLTGIFLTPEGMAAEVQPFGILLQLIRLPGNFISRYDVFFMMLWMLSFYMFVSGMLLTAVEMVISLQAGQHISEGRRKAALGLGILVFLLVCLVHRWESFDDVFRRWMLAAGVPACMLLIPFGVWKWGKVEESEEK